MSRGLGLSGTSTEAREAPKPHDSVHALGVLLELYGLQNRRCLGKFSMRRDEGVGLRLSSRVIIQVGVSRLRKLNYSVKISRNPIRHNINTPASALPLMPTINLGTPSWSPVSQRGAVPLPGTGQGLL